MARSTATAAALVIMLYAGGPLPPRSSVVSGPAVSYDVRTRMSRLTSDWPSGPSAGRILGRRASGGFLLVRVIEHLRSGSAAVSEFGRAWHTTRHDQNCTPDPPPDEMSAAQQLLRRKKSTRLSWLESEDGSSQAWLDQKKARVKSPCRGHPCATRSVIDWGCLCDGGLYEPEARIDRRRR